MKSVVADLVVGTHGEYRFPGRFQGCAMEVAVYGARASVEAGIRTLVRQMCRELVPEEFRGR
jgi:hypothetical protein